MSFTGKPVREGFDFELNEAFRAGNRARKKETVQDTVSGDMIDPIQDIIGADPDEFPYGKGNPSNYRHEVNALVRLAERFPERCKWSNPNFIGEAGSVFVIDDRLFIEISTEYDPDRKDCNMKFIPDLFFMGNSHAKKCTGHFDNQFNPVLNSYRQKDWQNVKDILCGEIGFPDKDVEIESNADELAMPGWGYVYVSMYRENIEKLVRWVLFSDKANEAFRAGNRARKKETVQDTVEEVDSQWPDMPKCIKVINELVRMGEWIHMGDLSDKNVDPETTDWWSWHLMPARDLNGGMTGQNDYHIFDLHVQLRKEDSEDPDSKVACKIYLFNDVPEDIIRDRRKRQMANSCTAYLDFHGPDYDGDNAYINQGPADDNGKKYHFSGGPERDIWRWVDNRGLSNILKLIMDAGTDRFRREMDSIAHCKPISVKLGYFGTNCWGNSNIYPLLCTFIEQWMSPSALSWSLNYDTNEYGKGTQLSEWRRKVEAWQGSKRMNEDGECCADAGGAAAPMPCAPVQTVMNTVGVGDPVPAGMPGTDEFGSGDRFDLQLGESPNKKSKKKPARKKGANEAFMAGNRARKKEAVQDTVSAGDMNIKFEDGMNIVDRIMEGFGAVHTSSWTVEKEANIFEQHGREGSRKWALNIQTAEFGAHRIFISTEIFSADTTGHPGMLRISLTPGTGIKFYLLVNGKYDNSWMTTDDGRGYWSKPLMDAGSPFTAEAVNGLTNLMDALLSPEFNALIQTFYTTLGTSETVDKNLFKTIANLILSPALYDFYTDDQREITDHFFKGNMVITTMTVRDLEDKVPGLKETLLKCLVIWEKRSGRKANVWLHLPNIDEAFRAGNRARKKDVASDNVAGVEEPEVEYESPEAVERGIRWYMPGGYQFRIGTSVKSAWSGFISKTAGDRTTDDCIMVNVQKREDGVVSMYVAPYGCRNDTTPEGKELMYRRQRLMRRNWTDTDHIPTDGDRFPATSKTVQDMWRFIELNSDILFSDKPSVDEAFRAGNRARKKEAVQDTVESVTVDWNKPIQDMIDGIGEADRRSAATLKNMLPENLKPIIEGMPGVSEVKINNSFFGGKELLIITPDHPDHLKIDGRFDIVIQFMHTRANDGDTDLYVTMEALLVFGYHDPDEITVHDFKYKWRAEIGRFSPMHTDKWGEALARICEFAAGSGFDTLDRLMTLDKWAEFRPFLGPDSVSSTFKAMNLNLFNDRVLSCNTGVNWPVMKKAMEQLDKKEASAV